MNFFSVLENGELALDRKAIAQLFFTGPCSVLISCTHGFARLQALLSSLSMFLCFPMKTRPNTHTHTQ